MSIYRLESVFEPRSVAVVGASGRPGSLGNAVMRNLAAGGSDRPLYLVNPRHDAIEGRPCHPDLAALPEVPDLAVIATPPGAVEAIAADAAARGVKAAVIITAGLGHGADSPAERIRLAARANGMRVVGPNCLGVIAPHAGLDASFAARPALKGDLALVSQSGAVAAALIDWAAEHRVGFSGLVSLGDQVDVDFGDLLDWFATDRATRAILLYIEAIGDARKFMSAARAAARAKPVIVVKAGRHGEGARAARSHTGALAGADAVYGAAFRRAGLLRVNDLDELFAAAETLARSGPFAGDRVTVVTNGGGLGVLAVDRLADLGGRLATPDPATMARLDAAMPPTWSRGNPVDIIGDADAPRYEAAMAAVLEDPATDVVLAMNCPTAIASSRDAAAATAKAVAAHRAARPFAKPVFAVWFGDREAAATIFEQARIPHFATESDAVRGLMHLVDYRRAQDDLMATPPSLPADFRPDAVAARTVAARAAAAGRTWLDPLEIAKVLGAYAIPGVPLRFAETPWEARLAAEFFLKTYAACAVKIQSQDIAHKSDVGGVALSLATPQAAEAAAAEMLDRIGREQPRARLAGVIVQPMISRPRARELIAGLADDPTFGPVVVFGRGGTAVEVIADKALALPPLDLRLARELVGRTRVARVLRAYRDVPAADIDAVALVLVKLAQLAADVPEIRELDLNPLLADQNGVIALDARIAVAPAGAAGGHFANPRFAIRPYPKEWERQITLRGGETIFVRPVRPEDEPLYARFFDKVTPKDMRLRFFSATREFTHAFIARLTQIDYARAMAFAAIDTGSGDLLGVVRLHADSIHRTGEYAILVRSDLKGHGLGWALMKLIIEYAAADGLSAIEGQVLSENVTMLRMCAALGFAISDDPHDPLLKIARLDVAAALR